MPQAKTITINKVTFKPVRQDVNGVWFFNEDADKPLDELAKITVRVTPSRNKDWARVELRVSVPKTVTSSKTDRRIVTVSRSTSVFDLPRSSTRQDRIDLLTLQNHLSSNDDIVQCLTNLESLF